MGMWACGCVEYLSGRVGRSRRVERLAAVVYANWKALTVTARLGICGWFLVERWNAISGLALNDTDDNIRVVQVKDWLAGQGWYDLRQYRLDPPVGANIHWSRIVDLPIAALMLFFRAFMEDRKSVV